MEHETIEKETSEVQETELKEEKAKKILIIIIVLLLFGGTCYYYAGSMKHKGKSASLVNKPSEVAKADSSLAQQENLPDNPENNINLLKVVSGLKASENKKNEVKPEIIKEEKTSETQKTKPRHKPTDKSVFLTIANKSSGKHDPFSYTESRFIPFEPENNYNSSYSAGKLPPIPNAGSMGNLPSISAIPGLPSEGLAPPPAPKPEDSIQIKGFIGNKVITQVNGVVEALNVNERIDNVKVLSVNPAIFTATYEIDGKKVTKTIKNPADEHTGDIQLVKNLHN